MQEIILKALDQWEQLSTPDFYPSMGTEMEGRILLLIVAQYPASQPRIFIIWALSRNKNITVYNRSRAACKSWCVFLCDHPYVPRHSDVSRKTQEANMSPLGSVPHLSAFQLLPCALLSKLENLAIIFFSSNHRPIALKSHCQPAQSPTGCK